MSDRLTQVLICGRLGVEMRESQQDVGTVIIVERFDLKSNCCFLKRELRVASSQQDRPLCIPRPGVPTNLSIIRIVEYE